MPPNSSTTVNSQLFGWISLPVSCNVTEMVLNEILFDLKSNSILCRWTIHLGTVYLSTCIIGGKTNNLRKYVLNSSAVSDGKYLAAKTKSIVFIILCEYKALFKPVYKIFRLSAVSGLLWWVGTGKYALKKGTLNKSTFQFRIYFYR